MAYVNTAAHPLTSHTIFLSQLLVEYSEFLHSWSYQLNFSQIKCAVYDEHQRPELFKLQRYPTMSQILDCFSLHPLIGTPAMHRSRLNLYYFTSVNQTSGAEHNFIRRHTYFNGRTSIRLCLEVWKK